jgi:hypothetical protein
MGCKILIMKRLFLLFAIAIPFLSKAQVPQKINTWYEYKLALFDTLGLPNDTVPLPVSLKSIRQFLAPHGDTLYMWSIALQKYILISGGAGGGSDGNNYPTSISFTNNRITIARNGTTSIFGDWDSSIYHSFNFYNTRYAATLHGHVASDVSDFTTAARNLFSAGTGMSYNSATGVFSWTGAASGITDLNGLTGTTQTLVFDSTYSGASSWSSVGTAHTLRLNRRLFDTTFSHSPGYLDGRYELQSNKSTSTGLGTSNTLYPSQNAVKVYADTKETAFTETTQEFTGSTSLSITLSNTPKSGKAEMYFLNGVGILASNVSRTGTTVTFSGITRWTSSTITAKYSY